VPELRQAQSILCIVAEEAALMGFAGAAFGLPSLSRVANDDHPQDIFSNNTYTVRTCVPFGPVPRFLVATVAVSHGTERIRSNYGVMRS
jgi:hypothetical protein